MFKLFYYNTSAITFTGCFDMLFHKIVSRTDFIKPGRVERADLIQFHYLKGGAENLGNLLGKECSVFLTNCKMCSI